MAAASAKEQPRMAAAKHPNAVEIDYLRKEMQSTLKGLVARVGIFAVQLAMPHRKHLFVPNLILIFSIISARLFTVWALKTISGHASTKRLHTMNSAVHHCVRTLGHIIYIVADDKDMFGRLFFLFVAPCSAARMSDYSSFIVFAVAHVALLFYRFVGNLSEEFPFVVCTMACVHTLHHTSLLKKRVEENALEKSMAMAMLMEEVTKNVFECFCEATACISQDMKLLQDSPSLSTLLTRTVQSGRCFTDFVHMGDREHYREFVHQQNIKSAAWHDHENNEHDSMEEVDHMKSSRVMSIALHLEDGMNIPVEVHIFHACLNSLNEEPHYLIGISERESYQHAQKKRGSRRTSGGQRADRMLRTSLDFETGMLTPSRPAFEQKDMEILDVLKDRTEAAVEDFTGWRQRQQQQQHGVSEARTRRTGSPRATG